MDTQGLFNEETDPMASFDIAALSFLISSINIYNIQSHIWELDLQYLRLYLHYSKTNNRTNDERAFHVYIINYLLNVL